mgnify:CR=1 FL=1
MTRRTINLNVLAREITMIEGKHESLSIAQVKEVLKITLDLLADAQPSLVLATLEARNRGRE